MTSHCARLSSLGWDERCTAALRQTSMRGEPGRVVQAGRLLVVQTERARVLSEVHEETQSGPRGGSERPICGDWVLVDAGRDSRSDPLRGVIRGIIERRNAVVRKSAGTERPQAIVANIDAVWIVCGLDRDQGLRSLLRYQALTRLDAVEVTVVLNKRDLVPDLDRLLLQARSVANGLDVIPVSAQSRYGLENLARQLQPCRTIALLGPSGVGKSTLINALTSSVTQATGEVRGSDRRGRHTTSTSCLVPTSPGAWLVDTPGLRELGLVQCGAGLDNAFSDVRKLAEACRFSDCRHTNEPGCQIRHALEQGMLTSERFLSFVDLHAEQQAYRRRGGKRR